MDFLNSAKQLQDIIVKHRRYLHQNAETEFALHKTKQYVFDVLTDMGCLPAWCGKAGVVATIGQGEPVVLLRADMDGLPVREESGLDFACTNGAYHGCGHDMHTAMLLGAAQLLKEQEKELCGTVKLMFQPAEEILAGATDMINSGLLDNPYPQAAAMIHVCTAVPFQTGTVIVSSPESGAPPADFFTVTVNGKGCHGSMPDAGIDSILIAAKIVDGLQSIQTRELSAKQKSVLTFGSIQGGESANVIPNQVILKGTVRSYGENTHDFIKKRMNDVIQGIAKVYGGNALLQWDKGCPALVNHPEVSNFAERTLTENGFTVYTTAQLKTDGGGSEDFSYISQKVPSVLISLPAGCTQDGFTYPLHHPKVVFDENALAVGAAVYATIGYFYNNFMCTASINPNIKNKL